MGLSPTLLTGPEAAAGAAPASLSPRGVLPAAATPALTRSGGEVVLAQWLPGWACGTAALLGTQRGSHGSAAGSAGPSPEEGGEEEGGKAGPISLAGTQTSVGSGRSCYCHLKGSLQGHRGRRAPATGARVPGGAGALPQPFRVIILLIPAQQHRGSPGACLAAPCCAVLTDMLLRHAVGHHGPCQLSPLGTRQGEDDAACDCSVQVATELWYHHHVPHSRS